jgi:hypothetical protein
MRNRLLPHDEAGCVAGGDESKSVTGGWAEGSSQIPRATATTPWSFGIHGISQADVVPAPLDQALT